MFSTVTGQRQEDAGHLDNKAESQLSPSSPGGQTGAANTAAHCSFKECDSCTHSHTHIPL